MEQDKFMKDFFKKHATEIYTQTDTQSGKLLKAFVAYVCEGKNVKVSWSSYSLLMSMKADFDAIGASEEKRNFIKALNTGEAEERKNFVKNLSVKLGEFKSMDMVNK